MHIRRALPWIAAGAGVIVAAGIVKLTGDHRKARLEDAFHSLTVGAERLSQSDIAGAQQHFRDSADRFQSLRRDPVMVLHHAFAARLRSNTPDLQEARKLAIPGAREDDALLGLALSQDSSLLAVATRSRLLCLTVDNGQWAEWPLPHPVERVGALHVDAETKKLHVLASDDGKLLTADCRTPGSSLISTASATENKAAVGWLDAEERMAWVAPSNPNSAEVKISARPLPGESGEPMELKVAFPGEANSIFPEAAVIHSIGRIDGNVLLFYGDANRAHDADLRDESVLIVSIDDPKRNTNRLVFAASANEDENGKSRWRSTHVRRLLPASAPGRVYALTDEPRGVSVLGPDAKPLDVHVDSLFATEYRDGREIYDLSVKSTGKAAVMEVGRRGTDLRLTYTLPWQSESEPALAAISGEGRHVVVADATGGLLLIDLSKSPGL